MTQETSLETLAAALADGESVYISGCAGEPQPLTQLLVDQPQLATGTRFIHSFVPGINSCNLAGPGTARSMQVFFMQPAYREAMAAGRVRYSPLNYFGIAQHLANPATALDTVIVHVSEPNAQGECSFGPMVEFMPAVLSRAGRILAVINPRIPQLSGSLSLALERISQFARVDSPLIEYDAGRSNPVTDQIVAHLVALIPNGATIEVGLGKVPAQLLPALHQHRDLGFHSGMLSDAILDLHAAGCVRKGTALTAAVCVGSAGLYQRMGGVANLQIQGVDSTHNPQVLAALPRLHAVNSALEIDLLGQVNAEMLNGRYVGGPGGLPDFAAAAHRQADGLSIIALPATDPKGRISRIVPRFAAGTPVAVAQMDVDVVVTEYGAARLRGADIETRMHRLIAIAHPDFRTGLLASGSALLKQI